MNTNKIKLIKQKKIYENTSKYKNKHTFEILIKAIMTYQCY